MSRRKNPQYPHLKEWLKEYSDARVLDFNIYSPYHMRIMDGGYTMVDIWTTARYWIGQTDYAEMYPEKYLVERGGEKGSVNPADKEKLFAWLDQVFYAGDLT